MGATAVTRSKQGNSFLATKEGLFIKKDGSWKCSLKDIGRTIRDLTCSNDCIYGVGDGGLFISSNDDGVSWLVRQFPTKASIWNIETNSVGLVITHGEKVIYLSTNAGKSWTTLYPFQFSNAPSIRSLCLYRNQLFIGTKIHAMYGGVWCFDLLNKSMTLIKEQKNQMISDMITVNNQLLVATGSCRNGNGKIEISNQLNSLENITWETCFSHEEQNFLDLNVSEGIVYSTSTQNQHGFSTISQVCIKNKEVVPCNYIKGHGWRICNDREDYIVAGLHESMEFTKGYMENYVM